MIDDMSVWSTKRPGDPASVGHRMPEDDHGRPAGPLCGASSHGLWFRRDHEWADVPERQRCFACTQGWRHLRAGFLTAEPVPDGQKDDDPRITDQVRFNLCLGELGLGDERTVPRTAAKRRLPRRR